MYTLLTLCEGNPPVMISWRHHVSLFAPCDFKFSRDGISNFINIRFVSDFRSSSAPCVVHVRISHEYSLIMDCYEIICKNVISRIHDAESPGPSFLRMILFNWKNVGQFVLITRIFLQHHSRLTTKKTMNFRFTGPARVVHRCLGSLQKGRVVRKAFPMSQCPHTSYNLTVSAVDKIREHHFTFGWSRNYQIWRITTTKVVLLLILTISSKILI